MDVPLLEQLARLLTQGRREAQRLVDAADGRYRERAVLQETLRGPSEDAGTPNRLLCGDPLLSLAALLSEQRHGRDTRIDAVSIDLHPVRRNEACPARFARWIPRLCLLQALAPEAIGRIRAPVEDHAALRLVLDATWPGASIDDAAAACATSASHHVHATTTLVLAEDAARCQALLPPCSARTDRTWIACVPDAASAARVRRAVLASDASLDIAAVGATPGEWARRHVGGKPVEAMHAALEAFGATPLAQANAGTTPTGRRRAGMEVLLGHCLRDGLRTLVWVDAPDRRTSDATLCRAITRRDMGAPPWETVVVLGWHFAPTFAHHLALRCDARIDAFEIGVLPRTTRRGGSVRVDPEGFRSIEGLTSAWIDRARSRSTPDFEWVTVQLRDRDDAITDWSIDPDHDGEVFRGCWHASRTAYTDLRSARVRVPWRSGPRRVCLRATDAKGGVSEVVMVVRHRPDASVHGMPMPPTSLPPMHARAEALC
jgi:hypothetical protein